MRLNIFSVTLFSLLFFVLGGYIGYSVFSHSVPSTILGRNSIKVEREYVPIIQKVVSNKVDTVRDTVILPKFIIKYRERNIDTGAILKAYFLKVFYSDTLIHSDTLSIIIQDTVSQNRIIYRNPIINFTTRSFSSLYIGGGVRGNLITFDPFIGGFLSKGNHLYGISYSPFSKSFSLYYYIKIKRYGK